MSLISVEVVAVALEFGIGVVFGMSTPELGVGDREKLDSGVGGRVTVACGLDEQAANVKAMRKVRVKWVLFMGIILHENLGRSVRRSTGG